MRDLWTFARATRLGVIAGSVALLLWPAHVVLGAPVRPAFIAALMLAAGAGVSILFMSIVDLITVERNRSVLPARLFDLALGLALSIPTGLALFGLLG